MQKCKEPGCKDGKITILITNNKRTQELVVPCQKCKKG
jgi:hypothetical protein